jgi:hypothetical protein
MLQSCPDFCQNYNVLHFGFQRSGHFLSKTGNADSLMSMKESWKYSSSIQGQHYS